MIGQNVIWAYWLWAFCHTWAFCHLGHFIIESLISLDGSQPLNCFSQNLSWFLKVCSTYFLFDLGFFPICFFLRLQTLQWPKNQKYNQLSLFTSFRVLVCMCLNMYKICISASRKRHDNHSYFQASTLQFATAPYLDLQEINSLHF